jgi:hypothetical protein
MFYLGVKKQILYITCRSYYCIKVIFNIADNLIILKLLYVYCKITRKTRKNILLIQYWVHQTIFIIIYFLPWFKIFINVNRNLYDLKVMRKLFDKLQLIWKLSQISQITINMKIVSNFYAIKENVLSLHKCNRQLILIRLYREWLFEIFIKLL